MQAAPASRAGNAKRVGGISDQRDRVNLAPILAAAEVAFVLYCWPAPYGRVQFNTECY
ncbi:hypothetical protein GCM10007907_23570 [Chitinimonas prasina]|uniref:Uncharacterized protein n=1 Tax=Chitinimonas prasina TaxID=1434937 RepID=A0ABQ5YGF8_9NEIS|nr:hypothetical protein GCM10007907_23570 [Chitinimonas prasina]